MSTPVLSSLVRLTLPIVLATLLQAAYQLTDAFWVGRLGGAAVAAVAVTFPVTLVASVIGIGSRSPAPHSSRSTSARETSTWSITSSHVRDIGVRNGIKLRFIRSIHRGSCAQASAVDIPV